MIKEACITNEKEALNAVKKGAQRLEYCVDLSCGGIEPTNKEVIYLRKVVPVEIPMMVMIRPRGGDFHYTKEEVQKMEAKIKELNHLPQVGFVFGCLTKEKTIDVSSCEKLLKAAGTCPCTFHMAFDEISAQNWTQSIQQIANLGFENLLTHGGPLTTPITNTLSSLQKIQSFLASTSVQLLIGGGVTKENLSFLATQFPNADFHGTKIVGGLLNE
ncbi:copper homeostasis protein CutC [Catellicoccus marimammalium]|uniref:Copper homeostasis protein cutC homolog n=1 Tax=Catellicoccus marimammalium M35/04/3 TaxID=1234409 RepID=K8ZKK1_9ENTE|nr:copper homeostasis protein CutC [Catellicoccus marimammalium]EKU27093.1 Cytoplasmic copper homeostasis protein cutC [Catellicoccus marimammalium M35/04/3]